MPGPRDITVEEPNPEQQGLKQNVSRRDTDIFAGVEEPNPEQQGLKPGRFHGTGAGLTAVEEPNPEQQGLKQGEWFGRLRVLAELRSRIQNNKD